MINKIFILISMLYCFQASAQYYTQASVIVWTRNFEEATATGDNSGIEKTEGGFSLGFGKRFNQDWSVELEFLPTMDFEVEKDNQKGHISMIAFTIAPKYTFAQDWPEENISLYIKLRVGWTKISGTDILNNYGKETSWTVGPALGVDYQINDQFSSYFDVGGLWSGGDVEDFDFFPWLLGLRYHFL
jgi:hypothetical protein